MTILDGARRVLRRRAAQLLAGMVAGSVTGWAIFSLSRADGLVLATVTGAVAGGASLLAFQLYGRAARLAEVTVMIPHLSELRFVVNDESRQVAWTLFVETVTRISIQPLQEEDGILRESLTSLYGLFATTRETLKSGRPSVPVGDGRTVEHFAIAMLNNELRPFLAKWHVRLREFEQAHPGEPESSWPEGPVCRADLRSLQARMYEYAEGFASLAGVSAADAMIGGPLPAAGGTGVPPARRRPAAEASG
ncbi:hypothetical protein [Kitasatospora sp. NPDC057015]|uniref:hypothetical protein n=1 Tax=Kitasatospora sp. NPDC057015 TaxID=3346001 RepID=UPI00362925E6